MIQRRVAGLAIGSICWFSAATAEAGPAESVSEAIELRVEVALDGPDSEALRSAVEQDAIARLDGLGHVVGSDSATEVDVTIGWHDESEVVFSVVVTAEREGQRFFRDKVACNQCGTPELFEQVGLSLEAIAEELATKRRSDEQPPTPAGPPLENQTPSKEAGRPRGLDRLGWAGVGLGSAGLVVTGVGIGLLSKGLQIEPDPGGDAYQLVTDFRPAGTVMTAAGGAALVGGLTLVVVDLVRKRRTRRRSSVALLPAAGAYITVGGSF